MSSSSEVSITVFDNELSVAYKWVKKLQCPLSYLLVEKTSATTETERNLKKIRFVRFDSFILDNPDKNIMELYDDLIENDKVFVQSKFDTTLVMLYYYSRRETHSHEGILIDINAFYSEIGNKDENTVRDVSTLENLFQDFLKQTEIDFITDLSKADEIEMHQTELMDIKQIFLYSPIRYTDIRVSANPLYVPISEASRQPQTDDGIDIFNLSQLTDYVSFLQYNENITTSGLTDTYNTKSYYKVYTRHAIDYTDIIEGDEKEKEKQREERSGRNTMYLALWSGTGNPEHATKKSYTTAIYNLERNKMVIRSPIREEFNEKLLIQRIENSLPLKFTGDIKEISVIGKFNIFGVEINETSFIDMILNDKIMSSYLYIDEKDGSVAEKRRFTLHYKSYLPSNIQEYDTTMESKTSSGLSSVTCVISQHKSQQEQLVDMVNIQTYKSGTGSSIQDTIKFNVPKDTRYIHVQISRASSREIAQQFAFIFSHLLTRYFRGIMIWDPVISYDERNSTKYIRYVPRTQQYSIRSDTAPSVQTYTVTIPLLVNAKEYIEQYYMTILPNEPESYLLKPIESLNIEEETSSVVSGISGGTSSTLSSRATIRGTASQRGKQGNTRLQELKREAPDLFVTGTSKIVSSQFQPKIITTQEELTYWIQLGKQILYFPTGSPQSYKYVFVCPDDQYPYPYVKENKEPRNMEQYPCLPICGSKNQQQNLATLIQTKCSGTVEQVYTTPGYEAKTERLVSPGEVAKLPTNIETILEKYTSSHIPQFKRYGIQLSPNSFLHCICDAVDEMYIKYPNTDYVQRESYVSNIRRILYARLFENIEPKLYIGLIKQELYDIDDIEIATYLGDTTKFFDPQLFYRLVEEAYNINVFVFTIIDSKTGMEIPTADGEGKISFPRYKVFYARSLDLNRRTICIYKTWGIKANKLKEPHCDLIMDSYDKSKIFGQEMTMYLQSILFESNKTQIWSFGNSLSTDIKNSMLYPYYKQLVSNTLQSLPIRQYIDSYGKCRAFIFSISSQELVWIVIPPSQPENLPLTDMNQTLNFPSIKLVLDKFSKLGLPKACTKNVNGGVTGLWFTIDTNETLVTEFNSIYIPVAESNESLFECKLGPSTSLNLRHLTNTVNVINRNKKVQKDAKYLLQLILWLFLVLLSKPQSKIPIEASNELENLRLRYTLRDGGKNFLLDKSILDTSASSAGPSDSTYIYDFSVLSRKLPQVNSYGEAIDYLSKRTKGFIKDGKIYIYSKKLYTGIEYFLTLFNETVPPDNIRENSVSIQRRIPIDLTGKFTDDNDFIRFPFTLVFTSEETLTLWLTLNREEKLKKHIIKTHLTTNLMFLIDPYIYEFDGKPYLIQNTNVESSFSRCITIGRTWSEKRINLGYLAEPYTEPYSYYIYTIKPGGEIILFYQYLIEGKPNALQILMYDEKIHFAAILPL